MIIKRYVGCEKGDENTREFKIPSEFVAGMDIIVVVPPSRAISREEWSTVYDSIREPLVDKLSRIAEGHMLGMAGDHDWLWEGLDPEDFQTREEVVQYVYDMTRITYDTFVDEYSPCVFEIRELVPYEKYLELVNIESVLNDMLSWARIEGKSA